MAKLELHQEQKAVNPALQDIENFLQLVWENIPEEVRLQYLNELSAIEKRIAKKFGLPDDVVQKMDSEQIKAYKKNLVVGLRKLEKEKMKLYNKIIQPHEVNVLAMLNQKKPK